jgi:hypothetical protein
MAIPFDVQKISSEVLTGVAVFVLTLVPKGVRWVKRRLSPTPLLTELRITAPRAYVQFLNSSTTDAELVVYLEVVSLTGKEFRLEHFQVDWIRFDSVQLPQVDGKVVPPRVIVPKHGVAEPNLRIRLHNAEIQIMARAAVQAHNVYSTPSHYVSVGLLFVATRRFSTITAGPKEVNVPMVQVSFPTALIGPPVP